jgi:Transglycosylase SLT domain
MRKLTLGGLAIAVTAVLAPLFLVLALLPLAGREAQQPGVPGVEPTSVEGIPDPSLKLYVAAARTCPGLGWHVLAGIGKIETDHGRSTLPGVHSGMNYAGAAGPMQFLISTWGGQPKIKTPVASGYAVDGDGDGWADIYKPADAIFAAAKYLCASGARTDIRRALFAYNHSWGYVDNVQKAAADYLTKAAPAAKNGKAIAPEQPTGADHITARMRTVRDLARRQFGAPYGIGCYRPNGGIQGGGEHPLGRACDFMLSSGGRMPSAEQQALGDAIAAWAQAHARTLGIYYIIWKQRIWNPDRAAEGWRPMTDRGSITENHFDHVHISVL